MGLSRGFDQQEGTQKKGQSNLFEPGGGGGGGEEGRGEGGGGRVVVVVVAGAGGGREGGGGGGGVPADTAPGPVPVCRACHNPHSPSQSAATAGPTQFSALRTHPASVVAHNRHATTLSKQENDELQLWDLDGLLTT